MERKIAQSQEGRQAEKALQTEGNTESAFAGASFDATSQARIVNPVAVPSGKLPVPYRGEMLSGIPAVPEQTPLDAAVSFIDSLTVDVPGKLFATETREARAEELSAFGENVTWVLQNLHLQKDIKNTLRQLQRMAEYGEFAEKAPQNTRVENIAREALVQNWPNIAQFMAAKNDPDTHAKCLDLLSSTVGSGIPGQEDKSMQYLLGESAILENGLASSCAPAFRRTLERMMEAGNDEQRSHIRDMLTNVIANGGGNNLFSVAHEMVVANDEEVAQTGKALMAEIVSNDFGLDGEKIVNNWLHNAGEDGVAITNNLSRNFYSLVRMTEKEAEAIPVLHDHYGITNFGRYPNDLLLQQYKDHQAGESGKPYGVIIYPSADHNGAFQQDVRTFREFAEYLPEGYGVKVIEVTGKMDLEEKKAALRNTYGPIHFGVIGGHGTQHSISLAGLGADKNLYAVDLFDYDGENGVWSDTPKPGAEKLLDGFIPNPPIALVSCSTGAGDGGMAKKISALGAQVVAPDRSAAIAQLSLEKDEDGSMKLDALYHHGGKSRKFVNGQEVPMNLSQ